MRDPSTPRIGTTAARAARRRRHHALGASRGHRRDRRTPERSASRRDHAGQDRGGRRRDRGSRARAHGPAGDRRRRARETAPARPAGEPDWKSGLAADFRHAVRALRLNRGFSAIVILTLAIGIGACTAVFSIINALLLGSLPYPNPEQLTLLWEIDGDNRETIASSSRSRSTKTGRRKRAASQSMGIWEYRTYNVASAQEPEQVQGIRASSSLFTTLGVSPALGRVFTRGGRGAGPSRRRDQRQRVAQPFWRRSRRRSDRRCG